MGRSHSGSSVSHTSSLSLSLPRTPPVQNVTEEDARPREPKTASNGRPVRATTTTTCDATVGPSRRRAHAQRGPDANARGFTVLALPYLTRRKPPGAAAEGGPTTPLTSDDLPRWIDDPRVDSSAMLRAFLAYRDRCTGKAYTQLGDIDMIVHDQAPTVVVCGQVIRPSVMRPLPTRKCTAQECIRCSERRGGYQFKWYHERWRDTYVKMRRREYTWHPADYGH